MTFDRKLGGFAPRVFKRDKSTEYIQEEYYCELCGRVSKEETELDQKTNKFLCEPCRKEKKGKSK